MPVKFSAWPDRTELKADLLGEHNEEILKNLADLTDGQIESLYKEKVLVRDPLLAPAQSALASDRIAA
jgi:CoA:oxalate CoA-transferase